MPVLHTSVILPPFWFSNLEDEEWKQAKGVSWQLVAKGKLLSQCHRQAGLGYCPELVFLLQSFTISFTTTFSLSLLLLQYSGACLFLIENKMITSPPPLFRQVLQILLLVLITGAGLWGTLHWDCSGAQSKFTSKVMYREEIVEPKNIFSINKHLKIEATAEHLGL